MFRPDFCPKVGSPGVRCLQVDNLEAQLAPLNLYGLSGFASAVVDGLRALLAIDTRPRRGEALLE
jgi:hypothetical protein